MNFPDKTKIAVILPVLVLLYGCGDRTDRTLNPPKDAKWVNVSFRVPDGVTLLPAELLYRSEKCKTVRYNSSNEPHDIPGYNDFEQQFSQQGSSNIWQQRVAIEGGGSCQWYLSSLRISFQLSMNNSLAKGKEVIATNYIFDFGRYGLSDGYGTGRAKEVSGDLSLKADFFPMVANHIDSTASLKFFGGNTEFEKWRRRFQIKDTQNIEIEPIIHLSKIVTLNPPDSPGNLTAIYPDGSNEQIQHIYPDYEKLLSMK
ncbi:hypothetical protein [Scandinavium lactucae]|uniref:Lipoprotein n=1 Tax=Scandinavium lactucae TaxID=3095028 RepID=A0ABU4QJG3_9ENTR|nr:MULTISPECIES: hypothetical protein [unclassified Scandinavium]MDX6038905.1 hypothetical protein [Scandinavium sp. V105_6]MDX6049139.1 hypothetical protein [Scandinavium sp. V105_1]